MVLLFATNAGNSEELGSVLAPIATTVATLEEHGPWLRGGGPIRGVESIDDVIWRRNERVQKVSCVPVSSVGGVQIGVEARDHVETVHHLVASDNAATLQLYLRRRDSHPQGYPWPRLGR